MKHLTTLSSCTVTQLVFDVLGHLVEVQPSDTCRHQPCPPELYTDPSSPDPAGSGRYTSVSQLMVPEE